MNADPAHPTAELPKTVTFAEAGTILLLGAGRMGGALLAGWLDRGLDPSHVVAVDPHLSEEMAAILARRGVRHETAVPSGAAFRVALIAVKPQSMAEALPALAAALGPETLAISIAAGTPIATFETHLGARPIVRAMPNTPAQVGRGVTVAVGNAAVSPLDHAVTTHLLKAVGSVEWVEDEALIDAVTAVSGSGPAYVFHLVEALATAGTAAGLPADLAMRLARGTVSGAGELLARADDSAEILRRNVTSPGGTTAAALAVLMRPEGLTALMTEAVAAAAARSRELSA
ncbi:pyrroline-5-carboxylate reductase [Segnochrobactrum spirostomi]|uniref:Pyrroline-5-carboxylate reductase n=1 Tax=Segnochrobactrum spirostomi TaxID=2608987 RepID=A0A6A7Y477_9HYPH|nr:pyrroline-5-carboxylate reductase [Segnochrobactrum spirostomi]